MLLRHYFFSLIVLFILSLQRTTADGDTCECRCLNRMQICDDLQRLQTEVDINTGDRKKWNTHYQFLQNFHSHWKQEILRVFNEEMEHKNGKYIEALGPRSEPYETNINVSRSKSHTTGEKQNLNNISDVESRLDAAEEFAKNLENDLRKERAMRKKIENESRQQQLIIETQREVLEDQVSRVEKKLNAVEIRAKNENEERKWLRSDVDHLRSVYAEFTKENYSKKLRDLENGVMQLGNKMNEEQNSRQKTESDIEEIRRLLRDVNPENYSKKLRDLENEVVQVANEIVQEQNSRQKIKSDIDEIRSQFRDLNSENYPEKFKDLENQVLQLGYDINQVQNKGQKLETFVRGTKYALLKIMRVLQPVVSPHAFSDLVKYLNATLGFDEDSVAELGTWTERNWKPEDTNIAVTSRLDVLEANVKDLNKSLEEAVSRIQILENKYKDAMKSTVGKDEFEIVESHERHPISRAFDARRDP